MAAAIVPLRTGDGRFTAQVKPAIQAAGTQLAFVHPGNEHDAKVMADYGLDDVPRVDDQSGVLYRAFGLGRGSLWQIAGPPVWLGGFGHFSAATASARRAVMSCGCRESF